MLLMKSRIYYFSGTGNSFAAAKAVANALGECELVPMTEALSDPELLACREEVVGFVSPNYYMGLPVAVSEFLKRASFKNARYLFMVATSGHDFGIILSQAERILKEKGKKLDYGKYLVMPDNYLPMFNITPAKAEKILKKAAVKLELICKEITASKVKVTEHTLLLGPKLRAWNENHSLKYAGLDSNFTVDDTCTSCVLCKRVCPVGNIEMEGKRPKWLHHCQQCYACMHFCPVAAIQYGKTTAGKCRYHHPEVTAAVISLQNPGAYAGKRSNALTR